MSSRWAAIPFLILAILLALAVAQVPVTWRGPLVALLLVGVPLGSGDA